MSWVFDFETGIRVQVVDIWWIDTYQMPVLWYKLKRMFLNNSRSFEEEPILICPSAHK